MFKFDKFLGFVKYKIYVTQLNELQTWAIYVKLKLPS